MLGLVPRFETDAASYGTAFHAAVEENLNEVMRGREPWSEDDSYDLFLSTFYELAARDNFKWTKLSKGSVEQHGRIAIKQFFELLPTFEPLATEIPFRDVLLHEDDERIINLEGTIDYHDAKLGLVDWKTGGRPYEKWEKQRWAKQPSVYTFAINWLELQNIASSSTFERWLGTDERHNFTYFVFVRGGEVQRLTVQRGPNDWAWLKAQCLSIAKLIEADLESWPLQDEGWHCSPLWCGAWSDCRGKHLGDSPW